MGLTQNKGLNMFGLFKPRVDQDALRSASSLACERLRANVELFGSLRSCSQEEIEEAINLSIETHMFALAVTMTMLNFTIQDAYFDAGLAGPLEPMPDFKMTADDERAAIRGAWAFVSNPVIRTNLDTRYRYIRVSNLNTPAEDALWAQMCRWCDFQVRYSFEARKGLNVGWLSFCMALRDHDPEAAKEILGR